MHCESDFLRGILANPDDDTPRVVFADFLQERGENDRAEFIRVQCELVRQEAKKDRRGYAIGLRNGLWNKLHRRQRKLVESMHPSGLCYNHTAWAGAAARLVRITNPMPYVFRRGFVEEITCTAREWLRAADAILAQQPIRRVTLTTFEGIDLPLVLRLWEERAPAEAAAAECPGARYFTSIFADIWHGVTFRQSEAG
jgi:uncharacterized protein (TIGR02996 family)